MKEFDLRLDYSHPPEILFKQQQKVKQSLAPYDNRVMFEEAHQTRQVPVPSHSSHLLLLLHQHYPTRSGRRCVQQPQQYVVDLGVDVLGEGLVEHGDEGLLHAGRTLGQRVAEEARRDLVEDQGEQLRLEAHDMREGYCCRGA